MPKADHQRQKREFRERHAELNPEDRACEQIRKTARIQSARTDMEARANKQTTNTERRQVVQTDTEVRANEQIMNTACMQLAQTINYQKYTQVTNKQQLPKVMYQVLLMHKPLIPKCAQMAQVQKFAVTLLS